MRPKMRIYVPTPRYFGSRRNSDWLYTVRLPELGRFRPDLELRTEAAELRQAHGVEPIAVSTAAKVSWRWNVDPHLGPHPDLRPGRRPDRPPAAARSAAARPPPPPRRR